MRMSEKEKREIGRETKKKSVCFEPDRRGLGVGWVCNIYFSLLVLLGRKKRVFNYFGAD